MSAQSNHSKNPWAVPYAQVAGILERDDIRVVDLRSPGEFDLDHLPKAVNLPLFDDAERALIGTLYKRTSAEAAFEEGLAILHERIAPLVNSIAKLVGRPAPKDDLVACLTRLTTGGIERVNREITKRVVEEPNENALVIHCWRGGLRSSSLVVLLRELGWDDVYALQGGYKSYRKHLLAELDAWEAPATYILRGSTGVGKTLVLHEIERLRPGWTLDLEGLADHRSSILGMVGRNPCSQKVFDSRLGLRLREGFSGLVVIEGESRKIGDSIMPLSVWRPLQEGSHLYLDAPTEYRIQVLISDYLATSESRAELREQLPFIERRLGANKWDGELVARLDDGREDELTKILLEEYYDPLYEHSEGRREVAERFMADDVPRVAKEIIAWIEARP
ncbi:MAG: tRNA 2-selenouridine synthase [Planctomycetota bacterium]|jgi:tRNA 2-selenouridine synthase